MRDRQQLALGLSDHLFCEELVARVIDLPTPLSAGGLLAAREPRIVAVSMDVGGQDQGEGELTEDYRRDKFDATLDTKLFDEFLLGRTDY